MLSIAKIIFSETEPTAYRDGIFWYKPSTNELKTFNNNQWKAVTNDEAQNTLLSSLSDRVDALEQNGSLSFSIVSALPSINSASTSTIYLVPNNKTGNNSYDEYVVVSKAGGTKAFEKLGGAEVDLSGYMKTDGSNYSAIAKTLVAPTVVIDSWNVVKANGTDKITVATSSKSVTLEPGAKVTCTGHFVNPTLTNTSTQASPTACSGDFGKVLPNVGAASSTVTLFNAYTSDTNTSSTKTVTFSKSKSGLMVNDAKQVVKASGNDTASASVSVTFRHKVYYGVNTATTLTAANITSMSSDFATSGAIGAKNFACTKNHYCYICIPSTYSTPTINYGTTVVGFVDAGTVDVVNSSGKTVTYKCLRSGVNYSETMTFKFS